MQRRLIATVVLAVMVAALVLGLLITLLEASTYRARFLAAARADAQVLASLLAPAVATGDELTATKQLASLDLWAEVAGSVIYLPSGEVFVRRERRRDGAFPRTLDLPGKAGYNAGRLATVFEPIGEGGELGSLGLRLEIPRFGQRFLDDYGPVIFASVLSLGMLAALLSLVLRRVVTGPVETLVQAVREVSEKKDYALRVPVTARGEFGRLAEAFNAMLGVIEAADAERRLHQDRLARQNRGLVELAQAAGSSQGDPARELRSILAILSRVHRVRRVAFWRLDGGGVTLRCVAGYDSETERHFGGDVLCSVEAPDYFSALRSEAVIAITDVRSDPAVADLRARYLEPEGVTAMLDLPVRQHGRLIGVLCHEHTGGPRQWKNEEINFASAVCDRVVLILESDELLAAQLALKESEACYREIVEAAPDGIFTIGNGGSIHEANTTLKLLTGWEEAYWREVCLADAVVPEDRAAALDAWREVSESGVPKVIVLRLLRADHSTLPLECHLVPRRQTAGPGAVLCVGRDQSERLRAQEAQAKLQDQLRHAQKMDAVGTLAGGIAHDFNNILTALVGNLELMSFEFADEHRARPYLENSLQATERARDLVRQILTFSRRQESRRRPVALPGIVAEALRLLRASLPASIEIITQFESEIPAVLADESQIHQVIMNLGTNAHHAMEPLGGCLSVEVRRGVVDRELSLRHPQLREGEYVVLAVADNGCGMDESIQRRLFEPFFTTKPQGRGTGLGMAVVHGILEAHEATAAVESAPGKGTLIQLFFPPLKTEMAAGPSSTAASGPKPKPPRVGRVLLVDDEAQVAQVAEVLLVRAGYTVRGFFDPVRALTEFQANPGNYDILVTDLTMPQLSGLELARQVRVIRPELPVLVMTGYGGDHHTDVFIREGIAGPLQKPFSATEFTEMVSATLKSRRSLGPRL